jgi:hypothetical protein
MAEGKGAPLGVGSLGANMDNFALALFASGGILLLLPVKLLGNARIGVGDE